jgi:ferritin-like metal-binding protein YciE
MEKKAQGLTDDSSPLTLRQLFHSCLFDLYCGETLLVKAIPGIIIAASNKKLQNALKGYLTEAKRQIASLEKILKSLELTVHPGECKSVEVFMEEAAKIIGDNPAGSVRDASLIMVVQKAVHYSMAVYGSLVELADSLGYEDIAKTLDTGLEEDEENAILLTGIARVVHTAANKSEQ